MPIETWFGFAVTAAAVIALPGPTVLLIITTALAAGRRAALLTVAGVAVGDIIAITLAFAGVGALLAAAPRLFLIVKWAGAAWLLTLGVRLWRRESAPAADTATLPTLAAPSSMFARGWLVTLLNPKGLLFFAALMPQFVDPLRPTGRQMVLLGATHVALAVAVLSTYVLFAGRLRTLVTEKAALRITGRAVAAVLVAAALLTALPSSV